MKAAKRYETRSWMRVVDVMGEAPVMVTPSQTAGEAHELMSEKGFRQLPVVDRGQLVGIISDRDIRLCAGGPFWADPETRQAALKTPVGALMTRDLVTLSPNDSLEKALEVFIEAKIGGIPVVDQNAGLLGIVTYVDLLRCLLKRIEEE